MTIQYPLETAPTSLIMRTISNIETISFAHKCMFYHQNKSIHFHKIGVIIQNWQNEEGIFYFVGAGGVVATKSIRQSNKQGEQRGRWALLVIPDLQTKPF